MKWQGCGTELGKLFTSVSSAFYGLCNVILIRSCIHFLQSRLFIFDSNHFNVCMLVFITAWGIWSSNCEQTTTRCCVSHSRDIGSKWDVLSKNKHKSSLDSSHLSNCEPCDIVITNQNKSSSYLRVYWSNIFQWHCDWNSWTLKLGERKENFGSPFIKSCKMSENIQC